MIRYMEDCLIQPIIPATIGGVVFSGIDAAMGHPITIRGVGSYITFIYTYNALQCPMEFIHGRQSLIHNFISAGTLGYLGVSSGRIGVPFINPYTLYRYPNISPPAIGFIMYGSLASAFAAVGGKRL